MGETNSKVSSESIPKDIVWCRLNRIKQSVYKHLGEHPGCGQAKSNPYVNYTSCAHCEESDIPHVNGDSVRTWVGKSQYNLLFHMNLVGITDECSVGLKRSTWEHLGVLNKEQP